MSIAPSDLSLLNHIEKVTPEPILGKALEDYYFQHVEPINAHLSRVVKPLHVFKIVRDGRCSRIIANLIIPVGATVHHDPCPITGPFVNEYRHTSFERKFRASEAYVHSLVELFTLANKAYAYSDHNSNFPYRICSSVYPTAEFDLRQKVCASGIHFFLNVRDAAIYF